MMRLIVLIVLGLTPTLAEAGSRSMTPLDLWKLKRIGPPSVAPNGDWCVVEVTTYNVDKDDSSSNLWLLSTDGKTQQQLTTTPGRNAGPRWAPDGSLIAFVSQRQGDSSPQIYTIAPSGGEAKRVTNMPMAPSALKWSADNKTLYCIAWTWPGADDATHLAKTKALQDAKSKAVIIDDAQYRYFDHWVSDGKRPTVYAVDLATGTHKNLLAHVNKHLLPTEPGLSDYDVSPDGKEICFVSDSAKDYGNDFNSDLYTLQLGDLKTLKNITVDNPAADTNPVYSPDGSTLAFLRTRVKYFYADQARLNVMDRATGTVTELTTALDRTCLNPKWLPDSKRIAFEAEDAGLVKIHFIDRTTKKFFTDTPPGSERSIDFATKDRVGVFLRSSFNAPPAVFMHKPGLKEAIALEHFNDSITKEWSLGKYESQTFKGADDKPVQQWVVYPPNFDPKKKWPLIQVVHGGPHNGIMDEFSFRWNLQLWAGQGYVVGCVNFHGSSGFGQSFTDSITGDLGAKPLTDIMKSTDGFAAQEWIDKDRMVAAGASYGGYMMAWMNGHTDRFKAMVCHAGVYDWHAMMASDIVKSRERSLGAPPWGDLSKVDRQSAQRYASKFSTPTLVLHGEKDFRVPLTQGLAYYNTLRQKGVPARLVYFPDENHWILKPNNSLVWHDEVFAWIKKYCPSGTK